MARLDKQFESAKTEWTTPHDLWHELDDEFGFTTDVCASPSNAKCRHYFTKEDNGLIQNWEGTCWMNPPYGRQMVDWIKKADAECKRAASTIVALIPVRSNTNWWHDIVMKHEVRFIRGRPKFGNATGGLPWPLAIIVFRNGD